MTISQPKKTRKTKRFPCLLCWHLPIFPGRFQPSIFGASELNFRVRDGNGCTLIAINTDYIKNSELRAFVYLNPQFSVDAIGLVTRTGFEPMLPA